MTNDSNENKNKISLTERIRKITSAAVVAGTLLIGSSADAAIPPNSSVVDRAVAIQDVLKNKMASDTIAAEKLPRAPLLLAHWGNRWGNWDNWNNWRNWNKWRNWANWLNF